MNDLKLFVGLLEFSVFLLLTLMLLGVWKGRGDQDLKRSFVLLILGSSLSALAFSIRELFNFNFGTRLSFIAILLFPAALSFLCYLVEQNKKRTRWFRILLWSSVIPLSLSVFFPQSLIGQTESARPGLLFFAIFIILVFLYVGIFLFLIHGREKKRGFFLFLSVFLIFGALSIGISVYQIVDFHWLFGVHYSVLTYVFNICVFLLLIRYRYLDYAFLFVRFIAFSVLLILLFPVFYLFEKVLSRIRFFNLALTTLMYVCLSIVIYFAFNVVLRFVRKKLNIHDEMRQKEIYRLLTDQLSSSGYGKQLSHFVLDALSKGTETSRMVFYSFKHEEFVPVEAKGMQKQSFPNFSESLVQKFFQEHSHLRDFYLDEKKLDGEFVSHLREAGITFISFCQFSGENVGFVGFLGEDSYFSYFDRLFITKILDEISAYVYFAVQKEKYEGKKEVYQALHFDLQMTRGIQEKMFPSDEVIKDSFDIRGLNRPAQQLSGDFYDYFVDRSGNLIYYLADVSGKNVSAAMVMIFAKVVFRLTLTKGEDLGFSMEEINQMIFREFSMGYFLTVFVGKIKPSLEMEYVCAGHEYPFLLRHGEHPLELPAHGKPVGILEESQFEVREIQLKENDVLFLYTDGLIDAVDFSGEFFGRERVQQSVAAIHRKKNDADVNQKMDELILEHIGSEKQFDDISLLSLQMIGKNSQRG